MDKKNPSAVQEHLTTHPPASLEAERFILGTLLSGTQITWDEVMDTLEAEDFHRLAHCNIFSCMETFYREGATGDILSISEELKKRNQLESVGGHVYLASLSEEAISTISIPECIRIIKEKSTLRKIIKLCSQFRGQALSGEYKNIDHFIDNLEKDLFVFSGKFRKQNLFPINSVIKDSITHLENLYRKKLSITGIASSFAELDHLTSGFQPGEFVIIAARPSMGKTALSLNIAYDASLQKKTVAFFSLEMSKEQILMRLFSLSGKIPLSHLRTGQISDKSWDDLVMAASTVSETSFYLDDSSSLSPFEIRSKARKLKAKQGLDLLVIDYLQLMRLKNPLESREREVSEISRLLKSLAKELNIPIIALSQLNRGVESRHNRKPMLSDLRESGSIEQDADVIMMLYRDDYYNPDSAKKGLAEVILNKQRNGPTGVVTLKWNPTYGAFENYIPSQLGPSQEKPPTPPTEDLSY